MDDEKPYLICIPREGWRAFLEAKKVRAWYMWLGIMPRAFAMGRTIYVRSDQAANRRLLAHELGHVLGLVHPPVSSADWWVDIMGVSPLRIRDRHALLSRLEESGLLPAPGP